MTSSAYDEMKDYWKKNRELERPLSPFLSSYKYDKTAEHNLKLKFHDPNH